MKNYINELIDIENKSRRFITQAIEIQKELVLYEVRAKAKGKILIESNDYNKIRKRLVNIICDINKIANIEGKGRDDFSLDTLISAENVMKKVSVNNSKSIRNLADKVKTTFNNFRKMLDKYSENIESVDPQLKNNTDLVDNLYSLETAWDKGKEFLTNKDNYKKLIFFSQLIEIICEKYKDLIELIEDRDPSIFVSIPGLLILKCMDDEDEGICYEFNPNMNNKSKDCYLIFKELKEDYELMKNSISANNNNNSSNNLALVDMKDLSNNMLSRTNSITANNNLLTLSEIKDNNNNNNSLFKNNCEYNSNNSNYNFKSNYDIIFLYNFLERIILFEDNYDKIIDDIEIDATNNKYLKKDFINKFLGKIKTLSMNLQREKPSEWNSFFDMSMNTISS